MYATIITIVGLGAGVTACVIKKWFASCGEETTCYEAVVKGPGLGPWFLGGHGSPEKAIRTASKAVHRARTTTPRDYSGCSPKGRGR